MITGGFKGVTMKNVVGYRISVNWTPINGFQDFFYVYAWDMEDPQSKFDEAVDVGENGAPNRGSLTLSGGERTYKFNNIDLMSAQVGVTRRFRYRLFEFRYDKKMVSTGDTPITLSNTGTRKLQQGGLQKDYTYSLDGGPEEQLYGFRARLAATGGNVLRFSAQRNGQNCFLEKIITANNERNKGTKMTEFKVNFPPYPNTIAVNQDNLASAYVNESYGYLAGEPQPPLLDLVSGDGALVRKAVTLGLEDYSQLDLIFLDSKQDPSPRETSSETMETATFIFNTGFYQDLQIK